MALAIPDVEDVIEACKKLFEQGFPTVLAAVDARKEKTLGVSPPVQYYFGDTKNTPNLPAMLFTGSGTFSEEEEYGWRKQIYSLEIEAYLAGFELEDLSRMTRRYGAAIDEMLRTNQTLGGVSREVLNIRQKYFDTMQGGNGRLLQAIAVTFDVIVFTD